MTAEYAIFSDGRLGLHSASQHDSLLPEEIDGIDLCRMDDAAHHGDESFHIVYVGDHFWLIGPFVKGASGAIAALLAARPDIPVRRAALPGLPYGLRKPGWLGLRLFPVAGFCKRPLKDLPALEPELESKIMEGSHV